MLRFQRGTYTLAAEEDEWRIVVLDATDEDRAARAAGWR